MLAGGPPNDGDDPDQHSRPDFDYLFEEFQSALRRIIQGMLRRGLLHGDDPKDLLDRTLRYLKVYLRSLTPETLASYSPLALKALGIYKALQVLNPKPESAVPLPGQKFRFDPTLPEVTGYQARYHYRPKYQVGGDLICVHVATNHNVWILLADVMGKSVAAHLTAASLEALWEIGQKGEMNEPLDVLCWLKREFTEYLPKKSVHVELVVLRANESGEIRAAAGGDIQYLVGNMTHRPVKVVRFGGMFLGRDYPEMFTVQDEVVPLDHEIVFATDGVFDQCNAQGHLRATLQRQVENSLNVTSLHDAVVDVVLDALRDHPQDDDIAVISLRRLPPVIGSASS